MQSSTAGTPHILPDPLSHIPAIPLSLFSIATFLSVSGCVCGCFSMAVHPPGAQRGLDFRPGGYRSEHPGDKQYQSSL